MSKLSQEYRSKPLTELCLPGSHDSAAHQVLDVDLQDQGLTYWTGKFDCLPVVRKTIENWTKTQFVSPAQQFDHGIREFDFRLSVKQGTNDFYFSHSYACERALTCLQELAEKIRSAPGEFVLITITKDFRNQQYLDEAKIKLFFESAVVSLSDLLIERAESYSHLTLDLIKDSPRVILNYPHGLNDKLVWRLPYRQLAEWTPNLIVKTNLIQEFAKGLISAPDSRVTCLTLTLTPSDALVREAIKRLDFKSGVLSLHFTNRAALQKVYANLDPQVLDRLHILETDFADDAFMAWFMALFYKSK